MLTQLQFLNQTLLLDQPAILVTVVDTKGSTPRESGATMVVCANGLCGTIGGGQLEFRAIATARELLGQAAGQPFWTRIPLGATIGQCCGGVVTLVFEQIDQTCAGWLTAAIAFCQHRIPWARIASLADKTCGSRVFAVSDHATVAAEAFAPELVTELGRLATWPNNQAERYGEWLLSKYNPPALHVALFGAGHVGRALVNAFAHLPLQCTWLDSREGEFLPILPTNTVALCTDSPESDIHQFPPETVYLVLTHSHALDFEIVMKVLDRGDSLFLGLIGSGTKNARFKNRLRQRGYTDQQLLALTCPIGLPGIEGKEPEVIAASVAAQVLSLRKKSS